MLDLIKMNVTIKDSDINVLFDACESYMLSRKEVQSIIDEVSSPINDLQLIATENQIPTKVLEEFSESWKIE